MEKNEYYLMARNRNKEDDLSVIKINGHFIYGLEEIDLFTMSFSNSTNMNQYLRKKKLLDGYDYDYFIATRKNDQITEFQEVVYSDVKNKLAIIARSFLDKRPEKVQESIDRILDDFSKKLGEDNDFYDKTIATKKYNIDGKYLRYFVDERGKNIENAKYHDNGWGRQSYKLIRNIVDCLNRYEQEEMLIRSRLKYDQDAREAAKPKIIAKTYKEGLPYGGVDLFSLKDED